MKSRFKYSYNIIRFALKSESISQEISATPTAHASQVNLQDDADLSSANGSTQMKRRRSDGSSASQLVTLFAS